jgi:hypothetical protein
MAREEAPRNKGTRQRRRRARGASGRAPSSPLPACRKVDGLEDETPASRARLRPGAPGPTPLASPRLLGMLCRRVLAGYQRSGPCVCPGGLRGLGLDEGSILCRRSPSPIRPSGEGAIPPPGRRRTHPKWQSGSQDLSGQDLSTPSTLGAVLPHSQARGAVLPPPPHPGLARPGPTPPTRHLRGAWTQPLPSAVISWRQGNTYSDHSCVPGGRGPC